MCCSAAQSASICENPTVPSTYLLFFLWEKVEGRLGNHMWVTSKLCLYTSGRILDAEQSSRVRYTRVADGIDACCTSKTGLVFRLWVPCSQLVPCEHDSGVLAMRGPGHLVSGRTCSLPARTRRTPILLTCGLRGPDLVVHTCMCDDYSVLRCSCSMAVTTA